MRFSVVAAMLVAALSASALYLAHRTADNERSTFPLATRPPPDSLAALIPGTANDLKVMYATTRPVDSATPSCSPQWASPVAAEVVDSFRQPSHQFGAGNRGLEFGTRGGEPVVAVDEGTVVFAGPVGGSLFVVVQHPGGLKSTYSYLRRFDVLAGEAVLGEAVLGEAASGFHLTARRTGRYLDPQAFIDSCRSRVKLVAPAD